MPPPESINTVDCTNGNVTDNIASDIITGSAAESGTDISPIGEVIGDDYLNPGDISGSKIEQALDRFKKDYFQYFYSDQIQQRKLDVYQHCVSNSCERVIHLNVRDVTGNMDKTGHPTSDASKDFAQKLMDTYFNE